MGDIEVELKQHCLRYEKGNLEYHILLEWRERERERERGPR